MDGAAVAGQLSAAIRGDRGRALRFALAAEEHDPAIRRLLRENPIAGKISLSFEREPSYFAAARREGPEHQTIIAWEDERIVCAGGISLRQRFINGKPARVGYLSGLRLDASCRGRAAIIRQGYQFFRRLHEQGGPALYLTSIIADNFRARRFLEHGLPGMPAYKFLGEFVTLLIRCRRGGHFNGARPWRRHGRDQWIRVERTSVDQMPAIVELLNRDGCNYQFAPVWSTEDLSSLARCAGLQPQDFRIVLSSNQSPIACAAIWDQRAFKQTVVRGYNLAVRALRPAANALATLLERPRLPAIGASLAHACLSHVAVDHGRAELLEWIVESRLGEASARGIDYLALGLDSRDPRLHHLRKSFPSRQYVSRLYAVHWEDGAEAASSLDGRLLAPEVALL